MESYQISYTNVLIGEEEIEVVEAPSATDALSNFILLKCKPSGREAVTALKAIFKVIDADVLELNEVVALFNMCEFDDYEIDGIRTVGPNILDEEY